MSGAGPSVRAQNAAEQCVSLGCAGPASAEIIVAQTAAHVTKDQYRHYHIIERSEDRDELGNQVNRVEEPRQQADQRGADPDRYGPIPKKLPDQAQHVGHDADQLSEPDVAGSEQPEYRDEQEPDRKEAGDQGKNERPIHAVRR